MHSSHTSTTYLVLEDALRDLCPAAAPDQLISGALEGHAAIQQGYVQVKHKAQHIGAAGALAQAQGW